MSQQPYTFQPFAWFDPAQAAQTLPTHRTMSMCATTRDIAAGVQTVLQMLERQSLDKAEADPGDPVLFSDVVAGRLLRLSVASLALLEREADWLLASAADDAPAGGTQDA